MMGFGMIAYEITLNRYPKAYNKQPLMHAALASQENYMPLYLMNVYRGPEMEPWFNDAYKASGKKLKNLPVDVISRPHLFRNVHPAIRDLRQPGAL
jgi:hypothetical protein